MDGKNAGVSGGQSARGHLTWELPLGTIRGQLEEPGPRFVDSYTQQERDAIQEVEAMPPLISKKAR